MLKIAYGCSKLLHFYMSNVNDVKFDLVVDSYSDKASFLGVDIINLEAKQDLTGAEIIIFAVSNKAINEIILSLSEMGLNLGENVRLYSDLFASHFSAHALSSLDWEVDQRLLSYATSFTLNSRKPVHTTICGTWLFLEALRRAEQLEGDVAEVGAFEGGNVLSALQSSLWTGKKEYYVFDSFEGFPDLTAFDPAHFGRGDYTHQHILGEVLAPFYVYPEAKIIKGFVPGTFATLPKNATYSLVFYDCDLYQPALDTYEYFWDRLVSGGMMLVHDYFAEPGGFSGVKEATDSFFANHDGIQAKFWHNTMAVFVKP
jgi:Macrocin-O-methyltransferase (TylF)